MADSATRPLRVGLYGFFGMGNLGNEGSLAAFLAHLRADAPGGAGRVLRGRRGRDRARARHPRAAAHGVPCRRRATGDRSTQARKALGRLWDVPRTVGLVGRVDVLVVPGTGVLESRLMSTPWGLPYWMALAFTACRLRGRPTALVSVGAEPATRPATRLLMRQVIRSATPRDVPRRCLVAGRPRSAWVRQVTRAPWRRTSPSTCPTRSAIAVGPGTSSIGVMTYWGAADDPGRGAGRRRGLRRLRMTEVVTRLLDAGRTVTFLVGDRPTSRSPTGSRSGCATLRPPWAAR